MSRVYCAYCGRVAHRCRCAAPDSPLNALLQRRQPPMAYVPAWRATPYKRGVPPQIKQRERAVLRRHASAWGQSLREQYGAHCQNCGAVADDETRLVLDHIISIARGGLSTLDNLQWLCATCNRIKGKLCIDCRSDTNPT